MYNVHAMKPLKVAEARARFGEVLDEAEQGAPVFIERRGVRFRVSVDAPAKRTPRTTFAFVDAAVLDGQWGWEQGPTGVRFKAHRKAR
jgi:hypothetical protein